MAIFVDSNTKVVVQGLTGKQGRFHSLRNLAYGTKILAGTNPKKPGQDVEGIPVFATVAQAVDEFGTNASCVFVPAPFVYDAVMEAASAGIELIVVITEGVPVHDEVGLFYELERLFPKTKVIGPNCPGIITPGQCNIGITPGEIALAGGPVGIVSRSGTLTYQSLYELSSKGIGQTTCVGIGGDPIPGTNFIACLDAFEKDPDTKAILMIGEIGGSDEEQAAEFITDHITKPVVGYVAGLSAPEGRKMGHAGAIVSHGKGTAKAKIKALEKAGVIIGHNPTAAGELIENILKQNNWLLPKSN